ncbi:uncharacterized protein Z518_03013 [Rhinocladiella mackenziei CBS 650.93]|uniref:Uncharacterized protein n=1 Tax=Rhinocladiella mackenziei CBS 650.93 TaxID=1442369 RepID=A0A0D2G1D9_9EURO|nr:uncharacterized protein Z518_03013 [Rhinocladiella mackenziei CBS 650.93]KIX08357.1 hypothetical protein Z518_03013 [Rhinocladiella mackenziei CBS 650.93]
MRALWSQVPRPKLNGSPVHSSRESITSVLVRKTTTAPLKRRPTFNDAFTILLAPVLATAFIVDTSWKDKQRKDWDEKLSVIKEEIEQIHERESRLRSSLKLRSIPNGLAFQRRDYMTIAQAPAERGNLASDIGTTFGEAEEREDETFHADRNTPLRTSAGPIEVLRTSRAFIEGKFSPEEMSNFLRYHRLNAITLAIRLLLHLHIGPSPFFGFLPDEEAVEVNEKDIPQDANRLAEMLRLTRTQMRRLKRRSDLFVVGPHVEEQASQGSLNDTIRELTDSFDRGKISTAGLVNGFGRALLSSDEVLSISAYVKLLRSFSKAGKFSLVYHVNAAMKNSTLPLTDEAIFHMIFSVGQACDSRSLIHILQTITRSDSVLNLVNKWERVHVNGLDLPVPASLNPLILQALVYAGLRCEQPERAEGWLSLLQQTDYGTMWKDNVFRSFLSYYTVHGNWEKGKLWLRRSVQHASSIASVTLDGFARVILRMLDLCVGCRKLPEYTMILDAAVNAGIVTPTNHRNPNDRRSIRPRLRSILLEWDSMPVPENAVSLSVEEKVRAFQESCKPLIEHFYGSSPENQKEQSQERDDELVLMPRRSDGIRYSVRRQLKKEASPDESAAVLLRDVSKMQDRFAVQDAQISQLKARLSVALERHHASQQEAQERIAREERWQKVTATLQEELKESKLALERLQSLNQAYIKEQATLQQGISDLKAIAKRLMDQPKEIAAMESVMWKDLDMKAQTPTQTESAPMKPDTESYTTTAAISSNSRAEEPSPLQSLASERSAPPMPASIPSTTRSEITQQRRVHSRPDTSKVKSNLSSEIPAPGPGVKEEPVLQIKKIYRDFQDDVAFGGKRQKWRRIKSEQTPGALR